jgi:hypothetical protein
VRVLAFRLPAEAAERARQRVLARQAMKRLLGLAGVTQTGLHARIGQRFADPRRAVFLD